MTRPIKFRCWEPWSKKMLKVYAVNPMNETIYVSSVELYGKPGQDVLLNYGDKYKGDDGHAYLMQFTGLYDRNGKEVWEGDILRISEYDEQGHGRYTLYIEPVQYIDSYFAMFEDEPLDKESLAESAEVIGNIYENPDLLTPTKGNE